MSMHYNSSLVPSCVQQPLASPPYQSSSHEESQHDSIVRANSSSGTSHSTRGSNQQLRSPVAKRPPNAKVTLQGWLHKQGSDGLQLWRRRWFVLSELCLFYYKSTEEEKLLGSVLLPSYRVSECRPEDKVMRKFAFKLEHVNMRTYLLAAESHKAMLHWICALNLACMLQNPPHHNVRIPSCLDTTETPSSSHHVKDATNFTHQPIVVQTQSNHHHPIYQAHPNAFQPLYENAPPKPRRVSESVRYDAVSHEYANHPALQHAPAQKYSHIIYANHPEVRAVTPDIRHRLPHSAHIPTHDRMPPHMVQCLQNVERRTPDTYGRSNYVPRVKINSDYEDVYNIKGELYEPPRSPVAYSHIKNDAPNTAILRNQQIRNYRPLNIEPTHRQTAHMSEVRNPVRELILRPHSVDFLEHNNESQNQYRQPERPKSSLDINQRVSYNENYFYTEEDYANKMRQSALYLHLQARKPNEYRPQSQPPPDAAAGRRHHTHNSHGHPSCGRILRQSMDQLSVNENPTIDTEAVYNSTQLITNDVNSPGGRLTLKCPQIRSHARQHQNSHPNESIYTGESDKKREESMKRLIQWKQRMLQSPLNYKQMSRRMYDQQIRSKHSPSIEQQHRSTIATSTPASARQHNRYHTPVQNTSYSSDDEDTERSRSVDVVQAGQAKQVSAVADLELPISVSISATAWKTDSVDTEIFSASPSTKENITEINLPEHLSNEPLTNRSDVTPEPIEDLPRDSLQTVQNQTNAEPQQPKLPSGEEHYMIMTSKKSILAPALSSRNAIFESLSYESEESSYVEMMQGLGISLLDRQAQSNTNREVQMYETVCFGSDKIEPVYMELGQDETIIPNPAFQPPTPTYHTLPDILISSEKQKSSKSDSSDADDEASKDFDSLDAPSQPRFSLSDTFRPASYYLGVNRVLAEFHDSSDSELVSPPPIPDASPLLDDLDTCIPGSGDDTLVLPANGKKQSDFQSSRKSLEITKPPCHSHSRSYSSSDQYKASFRSEYEFNSARFKRRPVSSEFSFKLDSLDSTVNSLLKTVSSSSRESVATQLIVFDEPTGHDYENMYIVTKVVDESRDNLNSSSNTLTSSTSESTFVAKNLLNESSLSLPASPCSLSYVNISQHSFDSSSNISIQFTTMPGNDFAENIARSESVLSSTGTTSKQRPNVKSSLSPHPTECYEMHRVLTPQSTDTMLSQLSRDYYLELLRSSGNSDTSTSTKNISLNNETLSDSKLDKQLRKADMFQIALTAKADSIDFMKFGKINNKNIYHDEHAANNPPDANMEYNSEQKKWYSTNANEGIPSEEASETVRRSHSLEGLLQNVIKDNKNQRQRQMKIVNRETASEISQVDTSNINEGNQLWEEDCVWQENLRRASHRHARSLDDLQIVTKATKLTPAFKNKLRNNVQRGKITRGVTYVNDCVSSSVAALKETPIDDKDDVYVHLSVGKSRYSSSAGDKAFIIDREKLRQWDLMSSAPVLSNTHPVPSGSSYVINAATEEKLVADIENGDKMNSDKNSASGSVSMVSGLDGQSLDHSQWSLPDPARTAVSPHSRGVPNTYHTPNHYDESERCQYRVGSLPRPAQSGGQLPKRRQPVFHKMEPESARSTPNKGLKLSAGELLGRTHEELVLLLIQLRRQSITTYQAIETSYAEIDTLKSTMSQDEDNKKLENIQRLEQLKAQLLDLGKQYEKSKPLVNLVDNMVKLGSLYQQNGGGPHVDKLNGTRNQERIQFNQHVQERRLLAEERRDWDKLNLNHAQLQSKIQQLYELDNALRYESGTLAGLRREKEYLERALQSLQSRLTDPEIPSTPPAELDRVRRHQQLLERELSRVHVLLAYNSKKLEETVAGNARIEQELLVLRQKLQVTQRQRSQPYLSNTIPKERKSLAESGSEMEGELRRVQWLMGDLQKQRQELSVQVRHLTDKSQNLAQQMQWPVESDTDSLSPALQPPSHLKRSQSSWLETDLDIGVTQEYQGIPPPINHHSEDSTTSSVGLFSTDTSDTQQSSLHEKQEIKTVRIVKRESERRHRDRERTGLGSALTLASSPASRLTLSNSTPLSSLKREQEFGNDIPFLSNNENVNLSPANIVTSKSTEILSTTKPTPPTQLLLSGRRTIPKEKRRHHTAPNNSHISREFSLLTSNGDGDRNTWTKGDRSLDDLDMERALRPRINTPDVVRSTLGHKELKYNERTIDSVLGTPSKIIIPERYMPQDLPQLSAEEERQRLRKVESIKKMLSDSTALTAMPTLDANRSPGTEVRSFTMSEEKRQREHLLQLNQILAKQVIEMSKIVAGSKDKHSEQQ